MGRKKTKIDRYMCSVEDGRGRRASRRRKLKTLKKLLAKLSVFVKTVSLHT